MPLRTGCSQARHFPSWSEMDKQQTWRRAAAGCICPLTFNCKQATCQLAEFGTARAPCSLVLLKYLGVDGESSLSGTSLGVDTTPDNLAVRVLRDLVADGPRK